ncbi:hypothetical protein [Ravibacter arvi]|uniref:hypothetical protein n=1 Tax=Ravibacter arvi TaxID=2051041 RepID=UPI0031EDDADF
MKKSSENRYSRPLQDWKESQQRLTNIFSPAILKSVALEREELAFRQELLARFRTPRNLEERITRKLLAQEKDQLEKKLYPNRVIRFLRQVSVFLAERFNTGTFNRQQHKKASRSQSSFRSQQALTKLVASQVKPALVRNETQQAFVGQEKFSESQQKNLLEGRSVERKGQWYRLDLADSDTKGRFALKSIPTGFDLAAKLAKFPFSMPPQTLEKLQAGEQVTFKVPTPSGEQAISLRANPSIKSLDFYDHQQKRISIKQLLSPTDAPIHNIGRQRKARMAVS